ncbi:glycosyltransferase [Erythrobacter insulae]|uniref:Glycosyltransferase n=1 Tax=Erythrobacter insulae TaxID=2584124 RepID=A0A547PC04_9SPHN|nr:glycosyltransferase [Erythrobacter insulae]TRD11668.1 glycosyltransferase [Erythrobacter insulae]
MTTAKAFSVIIPAHNEEAVIGRCLTFLLADAPAEHAMDIVVVANGCNDRTAEFAERFDAVAKVLTLSEGSKTAAINAGCAAARHCPRIVLDADVLCSYLTAAALADALHEPGVMTASPAISLNLQGATRMMQAYYRVWLRQPYAIAGKGGAGCYGLSRAAIETIGEFPAIIADDIWIHTRFPDAQKRYLRHNAAGEPVCTVVFPPRTAWEQIKVEARRRLGNAEVLRDHPSPYNLHSGGSAGLGHALTNGASAFDLIAFFGIKFAARLRALWQRLQGRTTQWTRDQSSRKR